MLSGLADAGSAREGLRRRTWGRTVAFRQARTCRATMCAVVGRRPSRVTAIRATAMTTEAEQVVTRFVAAWERTDVDELLGYFADDAVWHRMPTDPVRGKADLRDAFVCGSA